MAAFVTIEIRALDDLIGIAMRSQLSHCVGFELWVIVPCECFHRPGLLEEWKKVPDPPPLANARAERLRRDVPRGCDPARGRPAATRAATGAVSADWRS